MKDAVKDLKENGSMTNPFHVNYVQQYTLDSWLNLADNKPAMKVFTTICFAMDKKNEVVTSLSSLSIVTGIALSNVSRAVKWLVEEGYLTKITHMNCHLFSINPTVAWKDTTGGRIKLLHKSTNVFWAKMS